MSTSAPATVAPGPQSGAWKWLALGVLAAPVSLGILVWSGGSIALAAAPLAAVALVAVVLRGPLRLSAMGLLLAVLVLENPAERPATGIWRSPLYPLGALLLDKLNNVTGISALRFTGIDLAVATLFAVIVYRKAHGYAADGRGQIATAAPLGSAGLVSLGSVLALWMFGLATHGDVQNSLWQVQKILYVPVLFFLFQAAFLGPRDHRALARIVVFAACVKAIEGVWVRKTANLTIEQLPYVNTHSDSVIYAAACTILVAAYMLKPNRSRLLRCVVIVPLLLMGMVANNRRLVWVELGAALVTLFLMMPRNKFKRAVNRGLVVSLPIFTLYVAAGWNSSSTIFKPAETLRSMMDSSSDSSALSRDVENYNLIGTLNQSMLLGQGFGHEYIEMVKGDDISQAFPQYRYIPHNSLLGLWAFGGLLGFTGLSMLLTLGVFLGARAFRAARTEDERVAAFSALAIVAIYLIQAYGDMGAFSWVNTFMVAGALAVIGKLTTAVGAWPARRAPAPPNLSELKPPMAVAP